MIKDNCKYLTLKQVDALLARDGLGESVEYNVEALKARRMELLNKKAALDVKRANKITNPVLGEVVTVYPPPMRARIAKVERSDNGGSIDMVPIVIVQQSSNLNGWIICSIGLHLLVIALVLFFN